MGGFQEGKMALFFDQKSRTSTFILTQKLTSGQVGVYTPKAAQF